MAEKYRMSLKVRNYHIDGYGHVNNAQYLNLLEEARTQFMDDAGCPLEGFFEQGVYFFITDIHIKFKKPARLGDRLEISVWLPVMRRAQMKFSQEIRLAGSGEIIANAVVSCGCIKNNKIIPIPAQFLDVMQAYYIPE